jgi:ATP-binding cassette, subfamily F, member 3
MSLLVAENLSLSYGPKVLFDNAGFAVGSSDRVGLLGPNGSGKSSLMKVIAGLLKPDGGSLTFRRGVRVGYLPQDLAGLAARPLIEVVRAAVPGLDGLQARLEDTQRALEVAAEPEVQLELSAELAELHQEAEGYEAHFGRHVAERILSGLGFKPTDMNRSASEFSGGWKMRAALAGLLLSAPDLLLLDEPTNHLDVPTLGWFDAFLRGSKHAFMLISHDRAFLNRQVTRVLSLEPEGLKSYVGNHTRYLEQRAVEVEQLLAQAEKQATRRAHLEAFINRFRAKASKARQVQSRVKMLAKEKDVETIEDRKTVSFRFGEVARSGREVAELKGVKKSYGANVVYDGLDALLLRGEKVAVVGLNGAGKTTLLKLLAGELEPDGGTVTLGHNVQLAYYAQHHGEALDAKATVLEVLRQAAPERTDGQLRSIVGAFLFSGDDVDKRVGVLSGGERARVALARLLVRPANLLVMDEPTNHLDLDSTEALIDALEDFGGTVVFVSHNLSFLNGLATKVWDVHDRKVVEWPGNLDDYLAHLSLAGAGPADANEATEASASTSEKARKRAEAEARQAKSKVLGPLKKELSTVEARIAALETAQQERDAVLADPTAYQDFARLKPTQDAHRAAAQELEALYLRWEALQRQLEEV